MVKVIVDRMAVAFVILARRVWELCEEFDAQLAELEMLTQETKYLNERQLATILAVEKSISFKYSDGRRPEGQQP